MFDPQTRTYIYTRRHCMLCCRLLSLLSSLVWCYLCVWLTFVVCTPPIYLNTHVYTHTYIHTLTIKHATNTYTYIYGCPRTRTLPYPNTHALTYTPTLTCTRVRTQHILPHAHYLYTQRINDPHKTKSKLADGCYWWHYQRVSMNEGRALYCFALYCTHMHI